ncbi:unnamed protein product [Chondrus crispus]|uniref:Uncharacterized protein n=1 Tax=Chondrus crispus TaxID=2769 RepID=R7QSY3_CHOCR|nr:unnamed protein product [Chondrus crispus]CDF41249.1 unnamed protein product [Chondrus crispus]|eukprot:XP_005711543.1 unnamed protein product [Chondrus crispus]
MDRVVTFSANWIEHGSSNLHSIAGEIPREGAKNDKVLQWKLQCGH